MTKPAAAWPRDDAWVVAIRVGSPDSHPRGAGVVIGEREVLTNRHTVAELKPGRGWVPLPAEATWVAFPMAEDLPPSVRRQVASIRLPDEDIDAALLELVEFVPSGVRPAPLRCPTAADTSTLADDRWEAFGFPSGSADAGSHAAGRFGAKHGSGHVHLICERESVAQGFSGAGVWSPGFGAVVGLVRMVKVGGDRAGDGQALTLYTIDRSFPVAALATRAAWRPTDAGEAALAAWGWPLHRDEEGRRQAREHWGPRGRGVSSDDEPGFRFRGRRAALTRLVDWLGQPALDPHVLVVTGSPGVGKSAVLGRVVTTADAVAGAELAAGSPDDDNVVAPPGSVACAVHANGKTALEVAREVARAASVRPPNALPEFAPSLRAGLAERPGRRFNVVIDALDEAQSAPEARLIINEVALPIARLSAKVPAQVIVGTRRQDNDGDLLACFGEAAVTVDLDTNEYFAQADLVAYASATLQEAGGERPHTPYVEAEVAEPVAVAIAERAGRNFLIAGLAARTVGTMMPAPADVRRLPLPSDVGTALHGYLSGLPPVGPANAEAVFTALAYAQPPGLSIELWRVVLAALGTEVDTATLADFVDSAAANFLVESSEDGEVRSYRLFHQALDDTLLAERKHQGTQSDDRRAVADALIGYGRRRGWASAGPYLWRSLAAHAAQVGRLDELLRDDEYLLHADLPRLAPAADRATSDLGKARARMLRLTPQAAQADADERAALFSLTSTLLGHDHDFAPKHDAPYRGLWADVADRAEWAALEGHSAAVNAICTVVVAGRELLASAGSDKLVRLWDPTTRQPVHDMECPSGVDALSAATTDGRVLLASAGGFDGAVLLWDPATGRQIRELECGSLVRALCTVVVDGRHLLATAGLDELVQIWDPASGRLVARWKVPIAVVEALCLVLVRNQPLLATSAGYDDPVVRLWDAVTGEPAQALSGHTGSVKALCVIDAYGQQVLASAGKDGVRLWDPSDGRLIRTLDDPDGRALAVVGAGGTNLLAVGFDGVNLWDPIAGQVEATVGRGAEEDMCRSLCSVDVEGQTLFTTGHSDGTIRLWRPATGNRIGDERTNRRAIRSLCVWKSSDGALLASPNPSGDGIVLRDPIDGRQRRTIAQASHLHPRELCAVPWAGRPCLAIAGSDEIELWDPAADQQPASWEPPKGRVLSLCGVEVAGRPLMAVGVDNGEREVVYLLDFSAPHQVRTLANQESVRALRTVDVAGGTLLAAADWETVRLWDPVTAINGWRRRSPLRPLLDRFLRPRHQIRTVVCPEWVSSLSAVAMAGRTLLATGEEYGGVVRLWDPATGEHVREMAGHTAEVSALCSVTVGGRSLLASASRDRTVRIWDPESGACLLTIPLPVPAERCVAVADVLVVGLDTGIVALRISPRSRVRV